MAKFYLIDPSLRYVGGHHFEYALHVLCAAERAGWSPVLGTHRDFQERAKLPDKWPVYGHFAHAIYDDPLLMPQLALGEKKSLRWSRLAGLLDFVGRKKCRRRRQKIAATFTHGAEQLFQSCPPESGDLVFFATASELLALGIGDFLKQTEPIPAVNWHFQFHFNFLLGRAGDHPQQGYLARHMFAALDSLTSQNARHVIRLHTTTEQLTQQYADAGRFRFESLPYPINDHFRPTDSKCEADRPRRVVSLGDARIEKGFCHFPRIIADVQDDLIDTNKAEFVLQANFNFKLPCRRQNRPLVDARRSLRDYAKQSLRGHAGHRAVRLIETSLDSQQYLDQLLSADIGILPYDAAHYYSRCSGVLVEMLAAGIPVIVPAGCWMADQISAPIHRHQASLAKRFETLTEQAIDSTQALSFDQHRSTILLDIPAGATHLLVTIGPHANPTPNQIEGGYIRLDWQSETKHGHSCVVSACADPRATALWPLSDSRQPLRLRWQNAYDDRPLSIAGMHIQFLRADQDERMSGLIPPQKNNHHPIGAVGLIADDVRQFPSLLREIVLHYDHYRATALLFASQWSAWHNPDRVVSQLMIPDALSTSLANAQHVFPLSADLADPLVLKRPSNSSNSRRAS